MSTLGVSDHLCVHEAVCRAAHLFAGCGAPSANREAGCAGIDAGPSSGTMLWGTLRSESNPEPCSATLTLQDRAPARKTAVLERREYPVVGGGGT